MMTFILHEWFTFTFPAGWSDGENGDAVSLGTLSCYGYYQGESKIYTHNIMRLKSERVSELVGEVEAMTYAG